MPDESILFESITKVSERLRRREISAEELARWTVQRIERLNPKLGAFISFGGEFQRQARLAQRRLDGKNEGSPLCGVPFSVKDLIHVRGFRTSAGSRVFGDGLEPSLDAAAVGRLRRAGAVIVGKTNLHEFAYGVTNENAHFGPARNPWAPDRLAGGSSGGSAVAVACGLGFGSLGTDTRGSIRIPSACCGTTGLKPTLGRISTTGVLPLSGTLDHVGPMARSVQDVAALYQVLAGRRAGLDLRRLSRKPGPLTLGLCDYFVEDAEAEIRQAVEEAVACLRTSGLKVKPVAVEGLKEALRASGQIASAEALLYHRRLIQSRPQGYDPAVLKRLRKGDAVSGVDLADALQVRSRTVEAFRSAFRECDCLVGATVPAFPPRIGQDFLQIGERQVPVVENFVRFNAPQNVAGVPALALPCGVSRLGLPIGLQLIAGRGREETLLALGAHYQRLTDWHKARPKRLE